MSALVEHRADSADDRPAVAALDADAAAEPAHSEDPLRTEDAARYGDAAESESSGHVEDAVQPIQADPEPPPGNLRIDFGAHFEANYQRLVGQLYAITLDAGQAHDAVQDAYARAWRRWSTVGRTGDPSAWVRSVAVRSIIRSWRSVLGRFGVGRPRRERAYIEPRTRAMLSALRRLPAAERRALVLTYLAGCPVAEVAAIEKVSHNTVQSRLSRARRLITENLADDLPALLGPPAGHGRPELEELR